MTTQLSAADPRSMIDESRYPFPSDADGSSGEPAADPAWVVDARASLQADGVAILPGFVRPEAVAAMAVEAEELVTAGHHSVVDGTPYLALPDESFPDGHPRRALVRNSLTAIAYDRIGDASLLRALYEWPAMTEMVRRMLGRPELFHYADPLGALNVATMTDGDELGWHFDQTDFVVSLALQSSDDGGRFETAPRIRRPDDERYDAVAAILAADDDALAAAGGPAVLSLPMTPGTLMVFEGRESLHRVTPIVGDRARHVALLAYDTVPGTDSSELLKMVRYGRTQ